MLDKGNELKLVNSKVCVLKSVSYPCCSAPHIYIYDNNSGRCQFKCKANDSTFNRKNHFSKSVVLSCPRCNKALEPIKDRKFFVFTNVRIMIAHFILKILIFYLRIKRSYFKIILFLLKCVIFV